MVKIVRIIARLNIGGPAIHAILLSSELNKNGYKDMLVCGKAGNSEGDMSYYAAEHGIKPVYIPELGRDISFRNDFLALIKLFLFMKREKPHIVHTHTAKAGALGRLAAFMAGVPIRIHTFHGHVFDGYFNPVKAKIFLFIERFLALFTDKTVIVSEAVKNDIVKRLKVIDEKKAVVISLGFELDSFLNCELQRGALKGKLGLEDDQLLVGIVGRLVPIKNHRMFLDVASKVFKKTQGIKVKFLIIGDGESRNAIEQSVAENNLSSHVLFTGWVRDLTTVYADLDIVVLTSLNEGTPVSLIEAMASAKPVVATDVGGVSDIVKPGENGFLIEKDDSDDFVDKITILLRDQKKRIEFGEKGRAAVVGKYTKDRLVNDVETLYKQLFREKVGKME